MKNLSLVTLVMLLLIFTGCSYEEPVTFIRLQEVKINGIDEGDLLLSTKAVFMNPNNVRGKIKKVEIAVVHRRDTLAIVRQTGKQRIPANNQFYVPLSLKISINRLQKGLLSNLSNLITRRTVELDFKGSIKVSSWGVNQKVPIDYSEKIKF